MYLIAGLGNVGDKYKLNRHNIGFMIIDTIFDQSYFSDFFQKFNGLISEGKIDNEKVILCKPSTYMNRSGYCLQPLAQFYKIPKDNIFVIHDDIDLLEGNIRIKKGGGSGGHNGIKSIDQQIGNDYWRIRIGVGYPFSKDQVSDYVLSNFKNEDHDWIENVIYYLSNNIKKILDSKKIDKF